MEIMERLGEIIEQLGKTALGKLACIASSLAQYPSVGESGQGRSQGGGLRGLEHPLCHAVQ